MRNYQNHLNDMIDDLFAVAEVYGWDDKQFAAEVGVCHSTVKRWANYEVRHPRYSTLYKFAKRLGFELVMAKGAKLELKLAG